jgi:mRNA interferase MazF
MPFEFGAVVLVPFPFTDQSTSKQRPAVVVSTGIYNDARPDVVLMAITGRVRDPLGFGEVAIAHWQVAGLLKASVVKPVLATFEQASIIRVLGALALEDQNALAANLSNLLGQAP